MKIGIGIFTYFIFRLETSKRWIGSILFEAFPIGVLLLVVSINGQNRFLTRTENGNFVDTLIVKLTEEREAWWTFGRGKIEIILSFFVSRQSIKYLNRLCDICKESVVNRHHFSQYIQ